MSDSTLVPTTPLTPGTRVTHRSWGPGTVRPSPTAGGVAALVEFDSGQTVMVRAADCTPLAPAPTRTAPAGFTDTDRPDHRLDGPGIDLEDGPGAQAVWSPESGAIGVWLDVTRDRVYPLATVREFAARLTAMVNDLEGR